VLDALHNHTDVLEKPSGERRGKWVDLLPRATYAFDSIAVGKNIRTIFIDFGIALV
jgi:hypothetical protein